jgi:hypothetical protein
MNRDIQCRYFACSQLPGYPLLVTALGEQLEHFAFSLFIEEKRAD